jgi:hypothetical protein
MSERISLFAVRPDEKIANEGFEALEKKEPNIEILPLAEYFLHNSISCVEQQTLKIPDKQIFVGDPKELTMTYEILNEPTILEFVRKKLLPHVKFNEKNQAKIVVLLPDGCYFDELNCTLSSTIYIFY